MTKVYCIIEANKWFNLNKKFYSTKEKAISSLHELYQKYDAHKEWHDNEDPNYFPSFDIFDNDLTRTRYLIEEYEVD